MIRCTYLTKCACDRRRRGGRNGGGGGGDRGGDRSSGGGGNSGGWQVHPRAYGLELHMTVMPWLIHTHFTHVWFRRLLARRAARRSIHSMLETVRAPTRSDEVGMVSPR